MFNALKLVGFILLAQIPLTIIVVPMSMDEALGLSAVTNSIFAVIGLALILIMIGFYWNRYYTYAKEQVQKVGLKDIGVAILFFLAARILVTVGTYFNQLVYGEEETANDAAISNLTNENTFVAYFILFILAVSVLIPMLEELTFRGIFTNLIFTKRMVWLPLIVTSLVFGSLHLSDNVISFVLYALLGALFFLAYRRRRNIIDSMLVHIFHNGVGAVAMLFAYFTNSL